MKLGKCLKVCMIQLNSHLKGSQTKQDRTVIVRGETEMLIVSLMRNILKI